MIQENMHPLTLPIRKSQNLRLMVHVVLLGKSRAKWRRPQFGTASGIWFVKVGDFIHPIITYRTTSAKYLTFVCGEPFRAVNRKSVPKRTNSARAMRYVLDPRVLMVDVIGELERAPKPNDLLIRAVRKYTGTLK